MNVVNTFGANGLLSRYSQNFAPSGDYERFYAFDPQGNAAEMITGAGSSGTILASSTYDAFGDEAISTTTYADSYDGFGAQFGYFEDAADGLELLGSRYYDPAEGRFINRDPVGYEGGQNLYEAFLDNPLTYRDPNGHVAAGIIGTIGAGGGIGPIFGGGAEGSIGVIGDGLGTIGLQWCVTTSFGGVGAFAGPGGQGTLWPGNFGGPPDPGSGVVTEPWAPIGGVGIKAGE